MKAILIFVLWNTMALAATIIPSAANKTAPDSFKVLFKTSKGEFTVSVDRKNAPLGADRFYNLAQSNYFKDARFFRVVKGFVVQFGIAAEPQDSKSWKEAKLQDDPVKLSNAEGTLTFATAGPGTRTTQLFINLNDNERLDSMGFAPFGKVEKGLGVIKNLNGQYADAPTSLQDRIYNEGNKFLNDKFPNLDYIIETQVIAGK
jgi:peptidyl-prolyl cis-trans isomerase A (cyclophilin A)